MVKKVNTQEFQDEAMKAPVAVAVRPRIAKKLRKKWRPKLAMKYRVNSVPCLVLLKNGEFVDQSVGFRPAPQLTAWIDGNL